jgi:hypothetical protein
MRRNSPLPLPLGEFWVTHDADFLRLHADGVTHTGIAYCQQRTAPIGELLRQLVLIYDLLSPEEMASKIEFL